MGIHRTVEEASKKHCPLIHGGCLTSACMAWEASAQHEIGHLYSRTIRKDEAVDAAPAVPEYEFVERKPCMPGSTMDLLTYKRVVARGSCEAFSVYTESV